MKGQLIILVAPSGAGKTTLAQRAIKQLVERGIDATESVSYTTREPRAGEVEGRDYFFVSESEFQSLVRLGGMLEYATVFGRSYGTGLASTTQALEAGRTVFLVVDWQGAHHIRRRLPGVSRCVYILPPSTAALEARLRARGDEESIIQARMAAAEAEMSHRDEFDFVIVNDDLERATAALVGLCL